MKRSACLIFNPVAGQGNPELELEMIRALLEPEIDLDIYLTTEETDADELAQAAVKRGVEAIIASGGDGTLSAAATPILGRDIPFGIISRGTANAFAAALRIPNTIDAACQTILQGQTRYVDAAYCNGKPMVLLAGIGFEAETVEMADREAKKRFGMMAYILAGVQQLRNLQSFEVEIETDNKIIKTSASAITVANAAPPSSVLAQGPAGIIYDDGLLDLTIVAPESKAGAIAATFHLLQTASTSSAAERDDIGYLRANQFKINAEPPQKVVVDGEIIGKTPIQVYCVPAGLKIFVPFDQGPTPTEKLDGLPNLTVEIKESQEE
ncbi:YegS/Rv2252/BmrU family lipid kinase [Umezakia ovalisporum]|jgi:YegS/Rv2252/BmrU family lipid kinase|uniref:YegS/Rv2252/BmrU family lipid kinase n=1 Tax=Umezakia ovalisporum FSS-43 TaxID=2740520 RepID=A0ABT6K5X2_9CYAN|nr:YegS/Rv2252/BmrU family lipid kinase [Umezakia ovalisporum]MBI1243101.1 YegS/Rv2252/BmrU family lipid kinase [Nostoc sp. RI_552]MDH6057701.1 YegS/Rv2252/BmrU family lipid kinase [Umezakia ovalisporum FSS-43]MDH6067840.1 YegS/Rv2252/BmrU family lipid kinase [Umezakia ovalisporum APH033B]MDH6072278.1 YegS/Rv2252/BmrU family lipid kinase [Umezakia ovalisporum CobakiLakeA]MDH6074465.1 YegS/Rv2252/BmrU family lipid kinase [Umezakia ovalisporum CS-1034]